MPYLVRKEKAQKHQYLISLLQEADREFAKLPGSVKHKTGYGRARAPIGYWMCDPWNYKNLEKVKQTEQF